MTFVQKCGIVVLIAAFLMIAWATFSEMRLEQKRRRRWREFAAWHEQQYGEPPWDRL